MSVHDFGFKPKPADSNSLLGLDAVVKRVSQFIVDDFGETLIKEGISTTGTSKFGLTAEPVEIGDGVVTMKIGADKYYDFIDEGVNGVNVNRGSQYQFKSIKPSWSMINSLKDGWIAAKGISAIGGIDQTAYAIGTAIKRDGIKARNLNEKLINNEFFNRIENIIDEALFNAVDLYFQKLEEENGNNYIR